MAAFLLSANPNAVFDAAVDTLVIDTVSASKLRVTQQGANLVLSDGTNTAVLRNFVREQITVGNITFTDGSELQVGDRTLGVSDDHLAQGFNGTAGDDQLIGLGGDDAGMNGGAGNDLIYGNDGNDTILSSSPGNDTVFAGQGNDIVNYGGTGATALIYGNLGNDQIWGTLGKDSLFGGQGNDTIEGREGDDQLHGNRGLDRLDGQAGNDTLRGGDGEDTLDGGNGNDVIYGNQGQDVINGSLGFDTFGGAGGNDIVYAGQDADVVDYSGFAASQVALIYGNAGNDSLTGGAGNDKLYGGQGDDTIRGGLGHDQIFGNLGRDLFRFDTQANNTARPPDGQAAALPAGDSGLTDAGADVINGFVSGTDKIASIHGGDFASTAGTLTNYREFGDVSITSVDLAVKRYDDADLPNVNFTFVAGAADGYLIIDANADGTADAVVVLKGLNDLAGFDFIDLV